VSAPPSTLNPEKRKEKSSGQKEKIAAGRCLAEERKSSAQKKEDGKDYVIKSIKTVNQY
jgi:hypothetical protein